MDVEPPPSLNPRAQALMSDSSSGGSSGANSRPMMNRQGRGGSGYHRQHNNSGNWSDRDYNGPGRYRTKSTGQTEMDQGRLTLIQQID